MSRIAKGKKKVKSLTHTRSRFTTLNEYSCHNKTLGALYHCYNEARDNWAFKNTLHDVASIIAYPKSTANEWETITGEEYYDRALGIRQTRELSGGYIEVLPPLNRSNYFTISKFIEIDSETKISIAEELFEIADEIIKSKSLLDLKEDWDDEGALPIRFDTWKRAVLTLIECSSTVLSYEDIAIATPQINPGPESSIDIVWRTNNYRMMINFPEIESNNATFYGDNYTNSTIVKGELPTNLEKLKKFLDDSEREYFTKWLKNLKK